MKKYLLLLMAVSLTLGGCMRPMNANRPPHTQRVNRRPTPPPSPADRPDLNRRY